MEDNTPQVPVTQEVPPEAKEVPQAPQQPSQQPSPGSQVPLKPDAPPPKPKKWLKVFLIFLTILTGLGIGGFFIWKNFSVPETSVSEIGKTEKEGTEEEIYIYKGVWMPALGASVIPQSYLPEGLVPEGYDVSIMEPVFADFDKAEKAGINTFATQMSYWADERGELTMPPSVREFMANFIDTAHAKGFKVWLNPEISHYVEKGNPSEMRKIPEEWLENTDLIKNFELAIIETAKFAEEHDVEIFSPSSEMYANIGRGRSKRLIVDIRPKIEAVYSGKICLKAEWPIPEFLPHYSCFGPPANMPKNEQEKNDLINHLEQEREKNVELIIGELWEGNDWQGSQEDAKRGFEMALEAVKGRVNGIFILDTGRDYIQLFPESFESTIKEFYQEF